METAVNTLPKTELTVFVYFEKYDGIGFNAGNSLNGVYIPTLPTYVLEIKSLNSTWPKLQTQSTDCRSIQTFKRYTGVLCQPYLLKRSHEVGGLGYDQEGVRTSVYAINYFQYDDSDMRTVRSVKSRPLDKRFGCLYLEVIHIFFKRDAVSKKVVYITVDIQEDRSKAVLKRSSQWNLHSFGRKYFCLSLAVWNV